MKVLVIYGTTEGQTRKIAEAARDQLVKRGHIVTLADAAASGPQPNPKDFDAAIVAASLHVGHFQSAILHFVKSHKSEFESVPSAFISVSLSAASDDPKDTEGLSHCWDEFTKETGWMPLELHQAAGAFRFAKYDFFKRWGMKLIAYQKGLTISSDVEDLELTDWEELANFVDGFAVRARARERTAG